MKRFQEVFVLEAKDRSDLAGKLDMALINAGFRISDGVYEMTIRRLSKKEAKEEYGIGENPPQDK